MNNDKVLTREMLAHYLELSKKKKEIESELEEMKKVFNQYFDELVGKNEKGEVILKNYKLQRQIRKTEKYEDERTVKRLEELNLTELIQKRPDPSKIESAVHLGILDEEQIKDCKKVTTTQAIYVKYLESN